MLYERVSFESEGLMLTGSLVMPDSGVAPAAVLCVTGGGRTDCDQGYLDWQQIMSEVEIASLAFNARGIGGSEGSFRTDEPGFPDGSPANSQVSRAQDTITAYHMLRTNLGLDDQRRLGIIGASMGGDTVLRALGSGGIEPGAVVLKAPAAYHDGIAHVSYGPDMQAEAWNLGGINTAVPNNQGIRMIPQYDPMLLTFSYGDEVIPHNVRDAYIQAVEAGGGETVFVGDHTTPHSYMHDKGDDAKDSPMSEQARQDTYAAATQYFRRRLLQV